MSNSNTSILIIGGGTFGLSTAYRLAKAGYKNVTLLEQSSTIPAEISAGNDLNKIIRAEYEDPFYTELALKAMEEWKAPLFSPYFHQTGFLVGTSPKAPEKSKRSLAKSLTSVSSHPAFQGKIQPFNSREDIRTIAPVFDGPMNWVGYLNHFAGYAHAADALKAVYAGCCALDVKVHLGDGAKSLLFDVDTCVGARTTSGKEYRADRVVLALGASLHALLPQVGKQITSIAFGVAHIRLTTEEALRLRGIPVTYARDLGFFMEPDPSTNLLKLAPAGAGYTNFVRNGVSIPLDDNGWIPRQDETNIRNLLRDTLPGLANRPLINKKLCWCADTADSEYIIDYVPGTKNLVVATGDAGHAFKMLPVVGDWVKDILEKGEQDLRRWRWKEGQEAGGDVNWRVGETTDLGEFKAHL